MFQNIVTATERVQFQPKSALANRLIDLCQKTLDQADSLAETQPHTNAALGNKLLHWMRKEFSSELIKIVGEELNLTVAEVILHDDLVYMNAYMWPQINGDTLGWDGIHVSEVFSGTRASEDYDDYQKDIVKVFSDPVDLELSKLKKPNKKYKIGLGFFVPGFLTKYLFTNAEIITAEEIAAVIIHELGHGMTIIEHAADCYYRADAFKDSIVKLSDKKTGADQKDLDRFEEIAKHVPSELIPAEQRSIIDRVVTAFKSKGSFGIVDMIIFLIGCYLGFFVAIYTLVFFNSLIGGLFEHAGVQNRGANLDNKTSDRMLTDTNYSYIEQIADEFVSRHGMGSAFSSGFLKSTRYDLHGHVKGGLADTMSKYVLGQVLVNSLLIIHDVLIGGAFTVSNLGYDQLDDRLEKMISNNYSIFKDMNLPKEARDKFIADTDRAIKILQELRSETSKVKRMKFWSILERLYSNHNPIGALTAGNLAADYDTLQRLTNGLIRNPLFYSAARVQSLIDKK